MLTNAKGRIETEQSHAFPCWWLVWLHQEKTLALWDQQCPAAWGSREYKCFNQRRTCCEWRRVAWKHFCPSLSALSRTSRNSTAYVSTQLILSICISGTGTSDSAKSYHLSSEGDCQSQGHLCCSASSNYQHRQSFFGTSTVPLQGHLFVYPECCNDLCPTLIHHAGPPEVG